MARAEGIPTAPRLARAENGHARGADHRREVHRAGVVADISDAARKHRGGAVDAAAPGEVARARPPACAKPLAQRLFLRAADGDERDLAKSRQHRGANRAEALLGPMLRRHSRSGREGDQRLARRDAEVEKHIARGLTLAMRNVKPEFVHGPILGRRLDDAQEPHALALAWRIRPRPFTHRRRGEAPSGR